MITNLQELYRFRTMLAAWVLRDIRIRYKQSFLGAAWAILQPLSLMIVFTVVFSFMARLPTDGVPYPLFSYAALLPWTFFSNSVTFGVASLISNLSLVTKSYFPREILPLGSIGASFLDYLVASSIFFLLMLYYGQPVTLHILWLPVILILQLCLTLGITLVGAALNVFFRDIRFIVPLGMQIWLYASPVIYPITLVPERLRPLYMLNPMAGIIHSYRQIFLYAEPPTWSYLAISAASALLLFVGGYYLFKKLERSFADII